MYSHEINSETTFVGTANHTKLTSNANNTEDQAMNSQIIRYLRWAGSLLVILSAVGFMFQSYADAIPAYRYWVGLAIVLALCTGGLICNYLLRERTGARLFFALGTGFLPVQITQASAMLYAYICGDSRLLPSYDWLNFGEVQPALVAANLAVTGFLLLAVSYTGLSMLAKRQVKPLLYAYLLGNIGLLLPVRVGLVVPAVIVLMFLCISFVERKVQYDSTMQLKEGIAARALIILPLLILIGRSLLYPMSFLVGMVILGIVAYMGIVSIKRYTQSAIAIYISQSFGTVAAIAIWPLTVNHFLGFSDSFYMLMAPVVMMLFVLSTQVDYHAKSYRTVAALLATGLAFNALFSQHELAALSAIVTGIALVVMGGLKFREKTPLFCGQLTFLGGILFYASNLANAFEHAPWLSSIALGLVVLMLASVLEKKYQAILNTYHRYVNEIREWD